MTDLCVRLVPLFNTLSQENQIEIEDLVRKKIYQKGELVVDPSSDDNLIIVAYGGAKLYNLDENGHENITQILHTGDYAGEDWLFGKKNSNTYVEAIENSKICLLNRKDFLNLLEDQPMLSIKLIEQSMTKMQSMQKQIDLLSLPKIEDRLSEYLQEYAVKVGKKTFNLPLKMKDLALYLGTTPETLSRKFALLEKQGVLTRKLRKIILN
ncbi:Crp/Fnr family transcriptional regulator [Lactobacillus kitasatonis]|uniref:Crp/Fnr family transcriptional regulator n=1 Tax=Lactobacillus kitasatonis TaxID=237446 RepID=A0ABS1LX60_9LACO|nr:Crp/Fnr family transcriptional regulator [Lactobacillus kitasatonis]MBL1072540.1 Crp/Fnr family transcriptional regulator [Lactobacillus kitasatonis]